MCIVSNGDRQSLEHLFSPALRVLHWYTIHVSHCDNLFVLVFFSFFGKDAIVLISRTPVVFTAYKKTRFRSCYLRVCIGLRQTWWDDLLKMQLCSKLAFFRFFLRRAMYLDGIFEAKKICGHLVEEVCIICYAVTTIINLFI